MEGEFPFRIFFTIFCAIFLWNRAFYYGYAYATREGVRTAEEGLWLRRWRFLFGTPFLVGSFLYVLNPSWMAWSQIDDFPHTLRWLGIVLLFAALALNLWTHWALDKNFTDTVVVRRESIVVTNGPYHWVRHPMYVSFITIAIGTGLALANWFLALTGILLMVVVMIWRTPIEEKKLLERHGKKYQEYLDKTGRFFPKLKTGRLSR